MLVVPRDRAALLGLLLALLGSGCRGPEAGGGEVGPSVPPPIHNGPWTTAFLHPAVLVADEITIEGPADLLVHVAIRQDPENALHETKATERGLLVRSEVKAGRSGIEIRAQLDGLALVALRRLTVLQRPGEVPVLVRAEGNAWWSRTDGSEERRGATLELRGERER